MTIPLQSSIIYGPVRSRRLGHSLGINCFIPKLKICSLDCLYCQYGYTRVSMADLEDSRNYFSVDEILSALEESVLNQEDEINAITLSGNGESTLHPGFPKIVEGIIRIRNAHLPGVNTVILSNSTTLESAAVRSALQHLDQRIMKLDCGTEMCFQRFNRPVTGISIATITEHLQLLGNVIIQTMFCGGDGGNSEPEEVETWIRRLKAIRPLNVQIYSLDRPFPSRLIESIDRVNLEKIADKVRKTGIKAEVF